MKFKGTISKIDEGGVRAKTDNPKPHPSGIMPTSMGHYEKLEREWKEAEAQRKEYDIKSSEALVLSLDPKPIIILTPRGVIFDPPTYRYLGDRIEGEVINNEIVNVKIVQ